jgi:hypothetical protein
VGEETPQQRIARLQRELADAKVQALQAELVEAQGSTSTLPATPVMPAAASGFPQQPPQPPWQPPQQSWPSLTKSAPDAEDLGVLAPAPRPVPFAFKALVVPWSWWTAFTLFMVAVAPIALWLAVPVAAAIAGGATLVVVVALRIRGERRQLALLKWGEVATVTDADVKSIGTYYSGTTYQNVRLPQAHGWKVTPDWYSGPGTTTTVDYELNGTRCTLTLHGLAYDSGVILADKRDPRRALCVSSFAYDLDRDPAGNWVGHVPGRVLTGSVLMIALLLGWTALMVLASGVLA